MVNVKQGSVIVTYDLVTKDGGKTLDELKSIQKEKLATGQVTAGLPILEATAGEEKIISGGVVVAEGYDPIVITPTAENTPPPEDPPKMYGKLNQMQFFSIIAAAGMVVLSCLIVMCTWLLCR
jgi:hypothetical protein